MGLPREAIQVLPLRRLPFVGVVLVVERFGAGRRLSGRWGLFAEEQPADLRVLLQGGQDLPPLLGVELQPIEVAELLDPIAQRAQFRELAFPLPVLVDQRPKARMVLERQIGVFVVATDLRRFEVVGRLGSCGRWLGSRLAAVSLGDGRLCGR